MPKNMLPFLLLAGLTVSCTPKPVIEKPLPPAPHEMVISYHRLANQIGSEILKQGGNAFDAFVASTAAEYVLGEGVTSIGGPLGALLYDAKTKKTIYLDAGFNDPLDRSHKWNPKKARAGSAALVPGAPAGLEAISKKYGKISFAKALKPAIKLAEDGFPLSRQYADLLRSEYAANLKKSPYGLKTYFKDGQPLKEGDTLKLPVLASFLRQLGSKGSAYVYTGRWARDCLEAINAQGGALGPKDFYAYKIQWREPWHINYRGFDIYSSRTSGGLSTALALKVLEHADLSKLGGHYASSAEALETLIRVQAEVSAMPELRDEKKLLDPQFATAAFEPSSVDPIWKRLNERISPPEGEDSGSHSYNIVVVDRDGNAISGTNTIESFPWGKGLFVEGVPLSAAGLLPFQTRPGARRREVLTMQIGFKDDELRFASGTFSSSMSAAAFQFVVNVTDYNLIARDAATLPRFGDHAWDFKTSKVAKEIWLDPRIDKAIVQKLSTKGLFYQNSGYVDLGLGTVATIRADGSVDGALAPLSSVGTVRVEFFGIGANLELGPEKTILIREVLAGSPAEQAGLVKGDVIKTVKLGEAEPVAVDGKSVQEVISLIRGPRGTPVILGVAKSSGETLSLTILRDLIKSKSN